MHTTYKHIGKPSRLLVFLDEGVASPWYSHIEIQRGYLSFWACLVLTYLTSQLIYIYIDDIAGSRLECVGFTGSYWPLDHWPKPNLPRWPLLSAQSRMLSQAWGIGNHSRQRRDGHDGEPWDWPFKDFKVWWFHKFHTWNLTFCSFWHWNFGLDSTCCFEE